MKKDLPLLPGTFIKRYKRFFADILTEQGEPLTLHCPNTGSMKNCLVENSQCWYSLSDNPKRKLPGTLEIVTTSSGNLAGVNTGRSNHLVRQAIEEDLIPELRGYRNIRSEVRYGEEKSRIDLLLESETQDCYVEVKNVTLDCGDNHAQFPDAVTARGTKHLRELMAMVDHCHRAVLMFCVQLSSVETVSVAGQIDPLYAETLSAAMEHGVEVLAWQADLGGQGIRLARPVVLKI